MKKTNALRLLDAAGIHYKAMEYDVSDGAISGVAVAKKVGADPERVFKTLVTEAKTAEIYIFVIPCSAELDLKKAAAAAGVKSIALIKQRDLEPLTGYVHGGCSPVGMKKPYPTFIDETAILFDTIIVNGGRVGLQIELTLSDLSKMADAAVIDACV